MNGNKDVEIRIFGSRKRFRSLDLGDETRVAEIIRNRVLPKLEAEYYRVDVKIRRKPDQTPDYLVAYLLRKDMYLAEVVKVAVDSEYGDRAIEFNYDDSEDVDEDEDEDALRGEESAFDFIAATPVPDIPTAKSAVEWLEKEATSAGLKCKILLGIDATLANYKQYLTSGLKGFVNIGHGNTSSIILYDGPLGAAWFRKLSSEALSREVIYFNSCEVHNDPLKSAVMQAGARTFIGGIVSLWIGPSEEVCKCFWGKVLVPGTSMGPALSDCEKAHYPQADQGAHGISGDTGPFY